MKHMHKTLHEIQAYIERLERENEALISGGINKAVADIFDRWADMQHNDAESAIVKVFEDGEHKTYISVKALRDYADGLEGVK